MASDGNDSSPNARRITSDDIRFNEVTNWPKTCKLDDIDQARIVLKLQRCRNSIVPIQVGNPMTRPRAVSAKSCRLPGSGTSGSASCVRSAAFSRIEIDYPRIPAPPAWESPNQEEATGPPVAEASPVKSLGGIPAHPKSVEAWAVLARIGWHMAGTRPSSQKNAPK